MGVAGIGGEKALHVLMDHGVLEHLGLELLEFLGTREPLVDQKVADLHERRFLTEIRNIVAAVMQNSLIPIDEGNRRGAGTGIAVSGIEGEISGGAV